MSTVEIRGSLTDVDTASVARLAGTPLADLMVAGWSNPTFEAIAARLSAQQGETVSRFQSAL